MIQNRVKFFLSIFLLPMMPLALAGCGSTGGASLDDSASLAPAVASTDKKTTSSIATVSKGASPKASVASKSLMNKKTEEPVVAEKIVTAKAGMPPVPVKRPYRKVRKKKTVAKLVKRNNLEITKKIALKKPVAQKLDKPLVKKLVVSKPAVLKPAVVEPVVAKIAAPTAPVKAVETPMVPVQIIPVQITPVEVPQDIQDAFNEAPAPAKPAPEKMVKAEAVPIQHSFGQTDHRFSGQ